MKNKTLIAASLILLILLASPAIATTTASTTDDTGVIGASIQELRAELNRLIRLLISMYQRQLSGNGSGSRASSGGRSGGSSGGSSGSQPSGGSQMPGGSSNSILPSGSPYYADWNDGGQTDASGDTITNGRVVAGSTEGTKSSSGDYTFNPTKTANKPSSTTLCVKNNNWCNVKKPGKTHYYGAASTDSQGHEVFLGAEYGLRACMRNLRVQYASGKYRSAENLISYYTAIEKDRAGYLETIKKYTGFDTAADLKILEGNNLRKDVLYPLMRAMIIYECGGDPGVNQKILDQAYELEKTVDVKK